MPMANITVKQWSTVIMVNTVMVTDTMVITGIMDTKVMAVTGITRASPDMTGMGIMASLRLKIPAKMKAMKDNSKFDSHHPHSHRRKHDYPNDGSLSSLFHQCMHIVHHADGRHSGQGRILRILAKEGELTQREMQERLMIQAGSLSELVSKLEAKGMLLRERDENDKRKVSLKITPAGLKAVEQSHEKTETRDPFAVLTAEEQDMLRNLLAKLLEKNSK